MAIALPRQGSFSELGTPLFDTTFCVLDLETTGGSPENDAITEIGAIKVRGGQDIGRFDTLVRPAGSIMASIELLTGITNSMVASAPPIENVLPNLFEFMNGSVLVAHNSAFDSSFLSKAFVRHGYAVPFSKSVCTLRLARWLLKDETTDLKLSSLAASMGTASVPVHRAFADAAATAEIFHRMLELAGPLGVLTLEDLTAFTRVGRKPDVSKVSMASRLPRACGVYMFVDRQGTVLYVGKAKDLRTRVRSYFYSDTRSKVRNLVKEAVAVKAERTSTELAAEVRELELIDQHQPRYNSKGRSKSGRRYFVVIKTDPNPRFAVSHLPKDKVLGPFSSRRSASEIFKSISDAAPSRAGLLEGAETIMQSLEEKMSDLSRAELFEEAAEVRDRLFALAGSIRALAIECCLDRAGRFIYAMPIEQGFEVTALENGRLAASLNCGSLDEIHPHNLFRQSALPVEDGHLNSGQTAAIWRHMANAAKCGGVVVYCDSEFSETAVTGVLHKRFRDLRPAAR